MIEKLTRGSSRQSRVPVCRIDSDIWGDVFRRGNEMRLETLSRGDDRRDAELMFCLTDDKERKL